MQLIRWLVLVFLFASLPALSGPADAAVPAFDLSPLHGKVVYLDFWASWCVPCRESFPWMQGMQAKYASKGLVIVSVNVDEVRADAERFLARYGRGIEVHYDSKGTIARQYDLKGMPSSFLVNRRGTVRFHHAGFRDKDREAFEAEIRELLAEQ